MKNLSHKSNQFKRSKGRLMIIYKKMISQNKAERPLNITSILNNFKSFIKQVYEKVWRQNINKKKEQNNYFRAGISQNVEKVLTLKENKQIDF